mmetsp:Transcript_21346/g.29366  ORF Transcript_21346/g.29366 Transcript_21346/m.29366 type:complete len:280 (+) Transcript_21346:474-1313(+)
MPSSGVSGTSGALKCPSRSRLLCRRCGSDSAASAAHSSRAMPPPTPSRHSPNPATPTAAASAAHPPVCQSVRHPSQLTARLRAEYAPSRSLRRQSSLLSSAPSLEDASPPVGMSASCRRMTSSEALVRLKHSSTPAEITSASASKGTSSASTTHTAPLYRMLWARLPRPSTTPKSAGTSPSTAMAYWMRGWARKDTSTTTGSTTSSPRAVASAAQPTPRHLKAPANPACGSMSRKSSMPTSASEATQYSSVTASTVPSTARGTVRLGSNASDDRQHTSS